MGQRRRLRAPVAGHGAWLAAAVFALTVGQLAVGALSGLDQFEGKGFTARLVAYPLLMATPALCWLLLRWLGRVPGELPWSAMAVLGTPFLIDVTGNTLDLYDSIAWWDDANHLVNWFLLSLGVGLLLPEGTARPWLLGATVTGVGAVLAIGWELGEWLTFIRHGTERDTAYEDTLFDESLGLAGAALAGLVVGLRQARHVVAAEARGSRGM